jgi:hypothetical protein
MPSFATQVQLSSAASSSNTILSDIALIKGAFKVYDTADELQSVHANYVVNNQLVWVQDSGSMYQATVVEPNFIDTFVTTVTWNEFKFPDSGSGGGVSSYSALTGIPAGIVSSSAQILSLVPTGSYLVTASATNNVITFTQGDGSTFELTVATGSGGGGGGVSSYADLTNVPSGILSSSNQFQNLGDITISGSFLPSANEAFDLGSDTARWRDLHLSGSSIYMGGNLISIVDGALRVFEGASPTGSFLQSKLSGSFTGSFLGDGSQLTNVSAAPFFAATGSRYVTIEDIEISGSLMLDFSEAIPPLEIASGGITYLGVNGEGVTYFATRSSAPEVHKGGFYLDNNYNLYLGTD